MSDLTYCFVLKNTTLLLQFRKWLIAVLVSLDICGTAS